MSDPDEAFIGLVDEDAHAPSSPPPPTRRRPKPKKTVTKRRVPSKPAASADKKVGFYKKDGKTRPITAPGAKKAQASQPVKVIKKVVGPPTDWTAISKTKQYETDIALLKKYGSIPIPSSGVIGPQGAPLIRWDKVDDAAQPPRPGTMPYHDYKHPDAPHGLLKKLRKQFRQNRIRVSQGRDPVNAMLIGPPGTGKTYGVKKFAEETQLPYYYIPSDPNPMSIEQLLGRKELVPDGSGGVTSKWFDGTIIKAIKYGGILHIDEWSLLPGEIQTRFHELLDGNRRMSLV
ncbi:MAG: Denitrification regulatory protein NirQ, partial [Chlamydiae bacterium]|nr:Denitrification regulatory protein NirQ [Chlamydiota bacterium]